MGIAPLSRQLSEDIHLTGQRNRIAMRRVCTSPLADQYLMLAGSDVNRRWRVGEIVRKWGLLSEDEKAGLIPLLLDATEEWKTRTFDVASCMSWLKWKFRQQEIPFVESHLGYVERCFERDYQASTEPPTRMRIRRVS